MRFAVTQQGTDGELKNSLIEADNPAEAAAEALRRTGEPVIQVRSY